MVKTCLLGVSVVVCVATMTLSQWFAARHLPHVTHPSLPHTAPGDALIATDGSSSTSSNLEQYRALLRQSETRLRQVSGYTATFVQQVRKGDQLLEAEEIQIKLRHVPFSVNMEFRDKGLLVLYVEGKNDGRLLAIKPRGLLQRTLRLDPTSRIAMMSSRQPVTELGLLGLILKAQQVLNGCPPGSNIGCEIGQANIKGESVRQYTITFGSRDVQDTYSKCLIGFRMEEPVPVCVTCNGWTDDGQPGELIEDYFYRNVDFDAVLTDADFE